MVCTDGFVFSVVNEHAWVVRTLLVGAFPGAMVITVTIAAQEAAVAPMRIP